MAIYINHDSVRVHLRARAWATLIIGHTNLFSILINYFWAHLQCPIIYHLPVVFHLLFISLKRIYLLLIYIVFKQATSAIGPVGEPTWWMSLVKLPKSNLITLKKALQLSHWPTAQFEQQWRSNMWAYSSLFDLNVLPVMWAALDCLIGLSRCKAICEWTLLVAMANWWSFSLAQPASKELQWVPTIRITQWALLTINSSKALHTKISVEDFEYKKR